MFRLDDRPRGGQDALENAAEIAHVEKVVEFGGGGQHFGRHLLPENDRRFRQSCCHLEDALRHSSGFEAATNDGAKDGVDGLARRQGDVEAGKVPLETVGNIVTASPRVIHCAEQLNVHQALELAGLFQVVEPFVLHYLSNQLAGDLISPLVDLGHTEIIEEQIHLLSSRRTEGTALPLLYRTLQGPLEQQGVGGGGEVDLLGGGVLGSGVGR
mmetsp:Transcript_2907/g.5214  ORF Transcript_2907/g.5214 Transcript_2907/m.5214 type:complete len:213 (+) Transcript_2907:6332-6970(+)